MTPDSTDRRLLAAIADGLPLTPRPYLAVGARLGLGEDQVLSRLRRLLLAGVISRFGVVVRHRELGYRANAMVVWDIPDAEVASVGRLLATLPYVTLCYRRPRRPPAWPYNLFCMIHGKDRETVLRQVDWVNGALGLERWPTAVLFSRRRFKQRGAVFAPPAKRARGAA